VTMPMNVAMGLLAQAQTDLENFRAAVVAAAAGSRSDAYQKVAGVFRGGYELQAINEVLSRIENLNETASVLVEETNHCIQLIDDARSG
jgi:hypothetical protein